MPRKRPSTKFINDAQVGKTLFSHGRHCNYGYDHVIDRYCNYGYLHVLTLCKSLTAEQKRRSKNSRYEVRKYEKFLQSRPKSGEELRYNLPRVEPKMKASSRPGTVPKNAVRPGRKSLTTEVQAQPRGRQSAKRRPSPPLIIVDTHDEDNAIELESMDSDGISDIVKTPTLSVTVPVFPGALNRESTSYGVFSNLAAHSDSKQNDKTGESYTIKTTNLLGPELQGALNRESTSYGVFSNLSAHSSPKQRDHTNESDTIKTAKPGPQAQLLKAIKTSDVKQVSKLLTGNVEMTFDFSDDDGNSLLHLGISIGSDDMMKQLLSKKPPVDTMNKTGQTALHVAASQGREHLAYMLLQSGADVNLQNKMTGLTALHEAVAAGHKGMVDLLLCCGADATLKTKDGVSAVDMCNKKYSATDFDTSFQLMNNGRMEMMEVGMSMAHFKSVGIITEPRKMKEPTCLVCRRHGVNNRDISARLASQEEVISDEYSLRLGKAGSEYNMLITMLMPINPCSSNEELVLKTATGGEIIPTDIWQKNQLHWCKFSASVAHTASFVAVCRPRKEKHPVTKATGSFKSEVDPRIRIHLGKGSFNKSAHLSIQITELNEDVHLEEGAILSSTPFFVIDSDEPLSKSVEVELPEPLEYGGEQSETVVLTKESATGSWSAKDKVVRTDNRQASVRFPVAALPAFAVVLKCVPNYNKKSVTHEIENTFEQVQAQCYKLCFLCVTKRLDNEKSFRVAVECCEARLVESRRRFWVTQGFEERQERSSINEFKLPSKQAFVVKFFENIVFRQGSQMHSLLFHPKLTNLIQFDVVPKNGDTINGRVYIYQDNNTKRNQIYETEDEDLLVSVDINFVSLRGTKRSAVSKSDGSLGSGVDVKDSTKSVSASVKSNNQSLSGSVNSITTTATIETIDSKSQSVSSNKSSKNSGRKGSESNSLSIESFGSSDKKGSVVFLTNTFLDKLLDQMDEDWYKIFVLMGIPFQELEEAIVKTSKIDAAKKKLFMEWRDAQADRDDIGLPLLLSALFKGGCRNVANTIQIHLKRWHSNADDKNTKLYQWLCRAYQDSNLFVPTDYPKPMSDSYLVLMADELSASRDLGLALTLQVSEIDQITNCEKYLYPGIKVMKMLTMFREAIPNKIDALKKLIECLEKLNYDKLRNYSVMCARAWIKRTATRKDDPLRTQVDTLMKQL